MMRKRNRAALMPLMVLGAALIFSTAGCENNDNTELIKFDDAAESDAEASVAATNDTEQVDEVDDVKEDEYSSDDTEPDDIKEWDRWTDTVAQDGIRFLAEDNTYTDKDIENICENAVLTAETFCAAAFNYDADNTIITAQIESMIAKIGDMYFDKAENFKVVYNATNADLSYKWFEPSYVYVTTNDEYGDVVNIMGIARVHVKSDWIDEADYDATLHLKTVLVDDKWKIYDLSCGDLYNPGEVTLSPDESYKWIISVDGTPVTSINFNDPEGYLTHYTYNLSEE